MICENCNKENPENSNVCGHCGTLLVKEKDKGFLNESAKAKIDEEFSEENTNNINIEDLSDSSDDISNIEQTSVKETKQPIDLEEAALPVKSSSMMTYSKLAKKRKPLSTASFFGMQVLLLIPVINIFLLFIWAFRKKTNSNRQAYARSILIWFLLFFIIISVITLVMYIFNVNINTFNKFIRF